ncbi:hypothetical protein NECID01_0068 [Nematocida sp. AWRm77]|nr:hypothetical protein NECID01_0068 [Nematocida sp. AWRm77]
MEDKEDPNAPPGIWRKLRRAVKDLIRKKEAVIAEKKARQRETSDLDMWGVEDDMLLPVLPDPDELDILNDPNFVPASINGAFFSRPSAISHKENQAFFTASEVAPVTDKAEKKEINRFLEDIEKEESTDEKRIFLFRNIATGIVLLWWYDLKIKPTRWADLKAWLQDDLDLYTNSV